MNPLRPNGVMELLVGVSTCLSSEIGSRVLCCALAKGHMKFLGDIIIYIFARGSSRFGTSLLYLQEASEMKLVSSIMCKR